MYFCVSKWYSYDCFFLLFSVSLFRLLWILVLWTLSRMNALFPAKSLLWYSMKMFFSVIIRKKVSTLNLSFTRNSTPWFQFFGRPTIPFDDGVTTGSMSAVSVATSCPSHITGVAGLLCCTLGFEMDLFAFLTSLLFFFFSFCNDVVCRGLELLLQ